MKLFKNIDERFAAIGFQKVYESDLSVTYERKTQFGYVQCIDLCHKKNGYHLIQSSEKGANSDGFSNMVGITMHEARLCIKKMKSKGWKILRHPPKGE